jgi:hypothetical protein
VRKIWDVMMVMVHFTYEGCIDYGGTCITVITTGEQDGLTDGCMSISYLVWLWMVCIQVLDLSVSTFA